MPDTMSPQPLPDDERRAQRRAAHDELLRSVGRPRARDAAQRLGLSELELQDARLGHGVAALRCEPEVLLRGLRLVGEVMALTRNDVAVHERVGTYGELHVEGRVGTVLGETIDLRLFFHAWHHALEVTEPGRGGASELRSLQVFDRHGDAVHKVYARARTDLAAWARLVDALRLAGPVPLPQVEARAPAPVDRPDAEVDVAALRADWLAMRDPHEFFPLLKRHAVGRMQALRLAPPDFVRPVSRRALDEALRKASARELPVMVFVGNPGCIQIHTGRVERVETMGDWDNVLDPEFNLHVRASEVLQAFVVRKPTDDGDVTSIELFDGAGRNVLLMFGKRKPGLPELPQWRALVDELAPA
jgi:putative hemin transport protein